MKVRFKLKFIFYKTDYVTLEIPDDYILEHLELEDIKELDLSNDDSQHSAGIFEFVWDEIKGNVDLEDFEILNPELYPTPNKSIHQRQNPGFIDEDWKAKYNLKRV